MKYLKLLVLALLAVSLISLTGCAPKGTMSDLMKEKGYAEKPQDPFDRDAMLNVESIKASANVDPNYAWHQSINPSPGQFEEYSKKVVTWRIEGKSYFANLDEFNEVSKSIHPLVQKHMKDNDIVLAKNEGLYYYTLKSFEFDKDVITGDIEKVMGVVLADQADKKIQPILLVGYADEVGTNKYNTVLSQARADALKTKFEKLGLATDKLTILAGGETTDYGSHIENRRGILVCIVKR